MQIRILTSCTSTKAVSCSNPITADDFEQGGAHVESREEALSEFMRPAGEMYTGQQHRHLMDGVRAIRRRRTDVRVDLAIISGGYGVVSEERPIAPYERAFNERSKADVQDLAQRLNIPRDARQFLAPSVDLILVLLGEKYLQAIDPDEDLSFGGSTLLFCSGQAAESLPDWKHVKKVPVTRETAKRFSEGLVWLKGYLAKRLLVKASDDPGVIERVMEPGVDVLNILDDRKAQVNLDL